MFGYRPEVRNHVFDGKLVLPTAANTNTIGVQWLKTGLCDRSQANRATPNKHNYKCYSAVQQAVFVETEWKLLPRFSLTGGTRLDDHERYGRHVNPRAYAVWHATDRWTLKGGRHRAPSYPAMR